MDTAVTRDRKSKAPFTFALQLMVPGPPYRALVIAWAADSDPSALAEAALPRAGDASCADDDSDSELAPFELVLARCAQPAVAGCHGIGADGSVAVSHMSAHVAQRMRAPRLTVLGVSSVKQDLSTLRPAACACCSDRFRPWMRRFLAGSGPGANQLRSSMFKLVPSVEQGSWIIRQSVGNTPVLLGKKLKTEYHRCIVTCICEVFTYSTVLQLADLGLH